MNSFACPFMSLERVLEELRLLKAFLGGLLDSVLRSVLLWLEWWDLWDVSNMEGNIL